MSAVKMGMSVEEVKKEIVNKIKSEANTVRTYVWFLGMELAKEGRVNEKVMGAAMRATRLATIIEERRLLFEDIPGKYEFKNFLDHAHELCVNARALAREYAVYDNEIGRLARALEKLADRLDKLVDEGYEFLYKILW